MYTPEGPLVSQVIYVYTIGPTGQPGDIAIQVRQVHSRRLVV